jgi:hypothetical protein
LTSGPFHEIYIFFKFELRFQSDIALLEKKPKKSQPQNRLICFLSSVFEVGAPFHCVTGGRKECLFKRELRTDETKQKQTA